MLKRLKGREGFTLVELLVVIVILGILIAIGIQQFGGVQRGAAITAHDSNVRMLTSAGQMYFMSNRDVAFTGGVLVLNDGTVQNDNAEDVPFGDFLDGGTPPDVPGAIVGVEDMPEGVDAYTVSVGPAGDVTVYPNYWGETHTDPSTP